MADARAYVDLCDPEARNVFLKRSFEPDFFGIARAVLFHGGVYFDCGTNLGLCMFGLLPSIDSATVSCHLFEGKSSLDWLPANVKHGLSLRPDKNH